MCPCMHENDPPCSAWNSIISNRIAAGAALATTWPGRTGRKEDQVGHPSSPASYALPAVLSWSWSIHLNQPAQPLIPCPHLNILHGRRAATPNDSGQNHDHWLTSVQDTLFYRQYACMVQGIIACFDQLIDSWWRLRLPHPAFASV